MLKYLIVGLAWFSTVLSMGAIGDLPVETQILDRQSDGFPGKVVAMDGEWLAVGDPEDSCTVDVYRLDYGDWSWGNGTTANQPLQTLNPNNGSCNTRTQRRFGASIAIDEDWMVVAAPDAQQQNPGSPQTGAVYVYRYTGGSWQPLGTTPVYPNDYGAGAQGQDEFGSGLAIRKLAPDQIEVLIGSPGYNLSGGNPDAGKVYRYRIDGTVQNPSAVFQFDWVGENTDSQFGSSIAIDQAEMDLSGVRFVVGAPGFNDGVELGGAVYVYELTANAPALQRLDQSDATVGDPTWNELWTFGANVAIEFPYVMASGFWSYTFEDTTYGVPPTSYQLVHRFQDPTDSAFDVDIADVLQAYGNAGTAGVYLYGEPASGSGIDAALVLAEGETSYGENLDLYANRLVVNGEQSNRAYAYFFPCSGREDEIEGREWTMISVPCAPDGGVWTVNDVLGDLGVTWDANVTPPVDYAVFEQTDRSNPVWTGSRSAYKLLYGTDEIYQDRSYWVYVGESKRWKVDESLIPAPVRTPLVPTYANNPILGNAVGHYEVPTLPNGGDNGGNPVSVMMANPFPRSIDFSKLLIKIGAGIPVLVGSASGGTYVENQVAWVYDTENPDIPNGQDYRAVPATGTPGFDPTINPYEGFWIKLLPAATPSVTAYVPLGR